MNPGGWFAELQAQQAFSAGERRALAGDVDGAAGSFGRALRLSRLGSPLKPRAHSRTAELLSQAGRHAEAVGHLKALSSLSPGDIGLWRRLAECRRAAGQPKGEADAWRSLLGIDPDDLEAHERLAKLLSVAGRPAEAARHLRALAEAHPTQADGWRNLAKGLRAADDVDGEIAAWRRMLALGPDAAAETEAHERLAQQFWELKRLEEAIAHLEALAASDPGRVKILRRLALSREAAGRREAAVEAWRGVLDVAPADAEAHGRSAVLLEALGRPAQAVPHALALADAAQADARPWRDLARLQAEVGDAEGETAAWTRVLALGADLSVRERLAELLGGLGRRAEAATHLRALAEAAAPGKTKPWRRLAAGLADAGDVEGEIEALRRLLEKSPADRQSHERLAQALSDLGRPSEAAGHIRVLAEAEPGRLKGWRRLAVCLGDARQVEPELEAWGRVAAMDPDDLQAHERLAALLLDAGRAAEATSHLRDIVRLAPHNARAWRRLARALKQTGEATDDLAAWRETLTAAGQGELAGHLGRLAEAIEDRNQTRRELKVAAAAAEKHRERALKAQAALGEARTAERTAAKALHAERNAHERLQKDLQESPLRLRQAEAEEAYHLMTARALSLVEPDVDNDDPSRRAAAAEAYTREALAEAAEAGAVIPLPELLLRRAAGLDLQQPLPEADDARRPTRPVLVISSDEAARDGCVRAIGEMTGVPFAPPFPAALRGALASGAVDLDRWLAAVWSGAGEPRIMGFAFDPETFAALVTAILNGGAPLMGATFRRATALQLVWGDKFLFAADRSLRRSGGGKDFDSGDALVEVRAYRRLAAEDARLEAALRQLEGSGYRPTVVKAYRELLDLKGLAKFCRTVSPVVETARLEGDPAGLAFSPGEDVLRIADLLRGAVVAATAPHEAAVGGSGLRQFAVGRALEGAGRHAEALDAYLAALDQAPAYLPARSAAARYLTLSGDPAGAARLLRAGLKTNPGDQGAMEELLKHHQGLGEHAKAAAVGRLMRRYGVNRASLLAPSLAELGRYHAAEQLLRPGVARLDPDSALTDLLDLPALAEALPALAAAAEGDGSPLAQFRLAEALRRLGRLEQALPHYRAALGAGGDILRQATGVAAGRRPQFILAGPARTGTTLLRRVLELHPLLALPPAESSFFSDRFISRRRSPLGAYLDAFARLAGRSPRARVLGIKAPEAFSLSGPQIELASLLFPDLRVVIGVRDPAVRAWSDIKNQGRAADAEIIAALNHGAPPAWFAEVLAAGRYARNLGRWLSHVPAERIVLVDVESLETDPVNEAGRVFGALGVEAVPAAQILGLQKSWDNRTPAFTCTAALTRLLEQAYAGEAWRREDLIPGPGPARPRRAAPERVRHGA